MSAISGDQFVLRTEAGDVLIHASQVRQLTIRDMVTELPMRITQTSRHKRLVFDFDQADQEVEIRLMYFRPGVRWIPTYRIDLADHRGVDDAYPDSDKVAQLFLQAEIVNEAED